MPAPRGRRRDACRTRASPEVRSRCSSSPSCPRRACSSWATRRSPRRSCGIGRELGLDVVGVDRRRRSSRGPATSRSSSRRTGATSCTRCAAASRRASPTSASSPAASAARACSPSCAATASPRSCSRASTCRPASTSAARTPAEIALSILAEIVAVRRVDGASGRAVARAGRRGRDAAPAAARGRPDLRHDRRAVAGTPSVEHDGETVYFCCDGCKSTFEAQHEPCRRRGLTADEGHGRGSRRGARSARPTSRRSRAGSPTVDYLVDEGLATSLFLGVRLPQPLLLEGEAGVGKTEAAKALAARPRHAARAAAVLRGHRRRRGALRVELPAPAAQHPARRRERRDAARGGPVRPRLPDPAAAAARARASRARGRRCC